MKIYFFLLSLITICLSSCSKEQQDTFVIPDGATYVEKYNVLYCDQNPSNEKAPDFCVWVNKKSCEVFQYDGNVWFETIAPIADDLKDKYGLSQYSIPFDISDEINDVKNLFIRSMYSANCQMVIQTMICDDNSGNIQSKEIAEYSFDSNKSIQIVSEYLDGETLSKKSTSYRWFENDFLRLGIDDVVYYPIDLYENDYYQEPRKRCPASYTFEFIEAYAESLESPSLVDSVTVISNSGKTKEVYTIELSEDGSYITKMMVESFKQKDSNEYSNLPCLKTCVELSKYNEITITIPPFMAIQ